MENLLGIQQTANQLIMEPPGFNSLKNLCGNLSIQEFFGEIEGIVESNSLSISFRLSYHVGPVNFFLITSDESIKITEQPETEVAVQSQIDCQVEQGIIW